MGVRVSGAWGWRPGSLSLRACKGIAVTFVYSHRDKRSVHGFNEHARYALINLSLISGLTASNRNAYREYFLGVRAAGA
jgi:hypothetical protein